MLFSRVALVFSVLCTSGLAAPVGGTTTNTGHTPAGNLKSATQQQHATTAPFNLDGLWVGDTVKDKPTDENVAWLHIGIENSKIVFVDGFLGSKIDENPHRDVLGGTYWKRSPGTIPGRHPVPCTKEQLHIKHESTPGVSPVMFSPADGDKYGTVWKEAGSLNFDQYFTSNPASLLA